MRANPHTRLLRIGRALPVFFLVIALAACSGESSEASLEQARKSIQAGDHKAAIILLKNAIQENEGNAEARFQLGSLYVQMGELASAEKELRRARQAGHPDEAVNPLLARALIGQGEFKRVLEELPPPQPGTPNEVPMLVAWATAQFASGDRDAARKTLERAIEVAPQDIEVLLIQARFAIADRRMDEAMTLVDQALQAEPRHREALLFRADLLRAANKPAEAGQAYRALLDLDPAHTSARLALVSLALAENRLADARREVDSLLKHARNSLQGRYALALIEFRENNPEAARDQLAPVLKTAPGYLPAVLLAGAVDFSLGNLQSAESHLNKVIQAAPRNLYAARMLAAVQLRQGRAEDASRLLASIPGPVNDAGYHLVSGEVALAMKDYSKAAEHFETAARISPDSAAIRTELGIARLAQGDARAMDELQSAAAMKDSGDRADTVIILSQLRNRKFDGALASIEALEKKAGASPLTWNYRGAAYLGKKDIISARNSFSEALKLDPAFFPAAANLAELDLRDKQPAKARQRFDSVLKATPSHLGAMLALANLALRDNNEKLYLDWMQKAAGANPGALQPRLELARYHLARGNKNQALTQAREAVDVQPDHPLALDMLGTVQAATGDWANAIGTFRKLAEIAPNPAAALTRLASVQTESGQTDAARKSLTEALRAQPDFLDARVRLARIETGAGRHDEAARLAKAILQQKPKSSVGHLIEGDIAMARKQYEAALAAYERGHQLEPAGSVLLRQHAALEAMGRAEEGEKRLANWLTRHPQDTGTRAALAERLLKRHQYKAAADHYLQLNRSNPGNLVVLNNLAWSLSEARDPRAVEFAEKAHGLQPGNPAVMDTLGWILVTQGKTERGTKLLQDALSKAPDSGEIQYHLAVAYARAGDKARARGELVRLLDSGVAFPQEADARTLLKQLQGQTR